MFRSRFYAARHFLAEYFGREGAELAEFILSPRVFSVTAENRTVMVGAEDRTISSIDGGL